ncbi:MAG: efflux RND transporter periplasmic adaptor subunit [Comamonas sp.]
MALGFSAWRAVVVKRQQQQALQAQQQAPAAVLQVGASDWLTLQQRSLPLQVPVSGSLAAVDSALIKSRVAGALQDFTLREGDSVRKGQVIARVDATDSEARYRQAKLQADAAQAQEAIQLRQHQNNQALVDKQFISPTALATSEASLQAARANTSAARAAADAARKTLDDTVLRSPIDGQIARRFAQDGERVNVEAQVAEVVSLAALELQAPLPPQDSLRVQVGQTAQLTVEGSNTPVTAQVVRISPSAQSGSRAVPVYLRVQPVAGLQLRPGLFVQGLIATGTVQALALPLDAVRNDQPQPYIQTVVNGAVAHQNVQLGAQALPEGAASTALWVVVQGASAGSAVLRGSMGTLPVGTPVQLLPPAASAAPSAPPAAPAAVPAR